MIKLNLQQLPTPALPRLTSKTSLRSIYKPILFVIIGFIIGIYMQAKWLSNLTQCSRTFLPTRLSLNSTMATFTQNPDAALPDQETAPKVDIVEYLNNTTRVLCWILTNPNNHLSKAIHIRHTWGRRCNKLLFMSSQEDEMLQTIALPVAEGREHLWMKTKLALKYIYDHHLDDADWFLKADDDTYVIMENLRFFLYPYPPEVPIYFGCKFDRHISQGYMSGGAGYVLSKSALITFATESYNNTKDCADHYKEEDVQLGKCLENAGVIAGDSRDVDGKERFIPVPPQYAIPNITMQWYPKYVYHLPNKNVTCCSPRAISFHYIQMEMLYVLDYLLYVLRPIGTLVKFNESLPEQWTVTQVISEGLGYAQPLPAPLTEGEDPYF